MENEQLKRLKPHFENIAAIIDSILNHFIRNAKVVPKILKIFFKLVYTNLIRKFKLDKMKAYSVMAEFIYYHWIILVTLIDPHLNGLTDHFHFEEFGV